MCGIFFLRLTDATSPDAQQEAVSRFMSLQHRGPDNSGSVQVGDRFFGAHRLAIINPTPVGNQPFELNGCILICNGQIYNYRELAVRFGIDVTALRSDVDIILHLYIALAGDMQQVIHMLDGDFAFVLYDSDAGLMHIGRDIVGVRPLFWVRGPDQQQVVAVASELKALVGLGAAPTDTQVFPPGNLYTFESSMGFGTLTDYTEVGRDSRIVELLRGAVERRIDNSDRPVGFLCSGGLDSSIILCLAHEYLQREVAAGGREAMREMQVFSMQYEGQSDDAFYCKKLVGLLDPPVKYTPITYTLEDVKGCLEAVIVQTETYDPNTVRTSVANYLLAKRLRESTDAVVFLSGEGADELFCGYLYFNQLIAGAEVEAEVGAMINRESDRLVANIHMFDILKADRCFGAFGLEVRVPFLDKQFMEYVRGLEGGLKGFVNHTEKHLLRNAFKRVFPALVEARIIDRPKERFSDGVSYSYVPDLLRYCAEAEGEPSAQLSLREAAERKHYRGIFDRYYPELSHVIAERSMPAWCTNLKETVILS